ncbi:MAM domain-containing glycosylphosphatidylinositol anchor protein 2 isoform X1 [Equus quagga]|uniref:MAM domain-containing glycosylphosphatidylinositol anchor protein 2 isoform X1 n=1 Tax=Equus quagga TaxID=89248 RepID=UPI001EE2E8A6|nr:MAM domain-containing glycosylphosphatidylinositol anchor protein 2 isoform X1 [Equus quagga]
MSVGCAGLLRSAPGRRRTGTDGPRCLPGRAAPGHLRSARARVERAPPAAGLGKVPLRPPRAGYVHVHVKMDLVYGLVWLLTVLLEGISGQGVYAPPTVRIVHSGLACNIEEERYSERVYTIREGETLELTCLVTGHPRPQIRWTKTAGSASDRFQDSSVFNETLRITNIQRHQGGRYYCKAENGLGSPAIKSIRVDVYYLDDPVVTVHQSIGEAKEQFYYERTVFLRCVANSNPPVRYSWRRGQEVLLQGSDKGVEIYEPFFTQGETKILKLKNLRPQDYANYSCTASVRNVCNIPDKMVSFRLSNKTASPSIKLLVDDPIVVNPGEAITLVCVTTGGEPVPSLTWVRSFGTLPEKTVLNGGTLTIPAITSEDAGTYSCIANNNVGNPAKKSTNIIVRALKKGRFWITPDPYHKDDNIQIGREVKISCQVEAVPSEELTFSWFKNGRPLRSSERMVITQTDPDVSPGTTNLDIIDLKFTDFGTYTCVASLKGGGISDISIDVNISSSTVPPNLTVPQEKSPLVTREGDTIELQCQVTGKPKPIILWSRADKEVAMPDGSMQMESYDGTLRIVNVSREMSGMYRCQTSQYNGFNVKPREALVQLIVQYPPAVEPAFLEIRQGQDRSVTMSCRVLRAYPIRVLTYEWRLGNKLLRTGQFDSQEYTEYPVKSLSNENYGVYNCSIINEAGAGRCSFLVTGKAYAPEFYYDTYNPVWQNRHRVYSYSLQWTQMNPEAVDRIVAYRLGIRQAGQQRWWEQEIKINGNIQKGELITYNLTELIKPEAYEVRLTPLTKFGEGDSTIRVIKYSAPVNPHLREFHCGFEDGNICLFTQDDTDNFDWTKQSTATRNTKYTPNTGPNADRSGSKEGFYMYIETSRPRLEGEKARLLSPVFSIAPKNPYGPTNTAYCFSFFYHMYGQHIGYREMVLDAKSDLEVEMKTIRKGVLNVYLRLKGQTTIENPLWSSSGNKGQRWNEAHVNIYPITSFQLIFEGIRGPGIEGDIAIDDVSIAEGECAKQDLTTKNSVDGAVGILVHIWLFPVIVLISILSPRR